MPRPQPWPWLRAALDGVRGSGRPFVCSKHRTPQAPTSPAFPPATCTSKHTPRCGPCLHSHLVHSLAFNLETQLHWPPPSEPQTAVGRGRRAGSWRGCALMGSGTEPAGCVTPLPGERPLKCVLELARRPSAARRAAVCKGKPSWCPLRASARRRRERLPEASSHWQTGLSRCLANEHSDPQPPKQSGWGGGAALTTAPGPETQAAPPPHGQPPPHVREALSSPPFSRNGSKCRKCGVVAVGSEWAAVNG